MRRLATRSRVPRIKILIVGSGLIGLTTAYYLKQRGHEVIVIDREDGPGRETSFANGALLTPSMSEPWIAPGSWRMLLASIGRADAPLQLRLRALPGMACWGFQALKYSQPEPYQRNTRSNLHLALYSLQSMQALREHTHIEYGRATPGTLRIFRDPAAWHHAAARGADLPSQGVPCDKLSVAQTVALEPALIPIARQLAGSIHYQGDEIGDAYQFCERLAEHLRQRGVEFHFQSDVASIEVRAGRVTAVLTAPERIPADGLVVAAGSYSTRLLRTAGIRLPVIPVKGYSINFDHAHNPSSLSVPIVDDQLHAVMVPLNGALRAAGTAEFTQFDATLDPARVDNLLRLVNLVLPDETFEPTAASSWCGFRAMSADGVPIIGPTPVRNLWVNTGHGHLGWTMATGSGALLADLIGGQVPAIDPTPYQLQRFAAK